MKTEREMLEGKMFQAVCDLIHNNGRHFGKEDWRRIFRDALDNGFPDETLESSD